MLEDEILEEIEKGSQEEANTIVEIDDPESEKTQVFDFEHDLNKDGDEPPKENKKKKKNKKPSRWSCLPKKKKIIIIVSICVVLLIILILVLYFVVFKDKEEKPEEKKKEPIVIVEKDNYRYEGGVLYFEGADKTDIGSYECTNKDDDLCYVAYYKDEDEFDVAKYVYETGIAVETRTSIYNDRYALVFDNESASEGNIILYDIKEKKNIGTYKYAKEVNDDIVILKNEEDKYGLVSLKDEVDNVIDFNYDYLGYIADSEKIVGQKDLNYYLLDFNGKELTKSIPGEIKNFDDKYISVLIDGDHYLYNYQGKRAKEEDYDYFYFTDGYVAGIKTRKIFFFNSELQQLNIDGIKLASNNYSPKIIFNEDKTEKDREEAFVIDAKKDRIEVEVDDEISVINVYEGSFSASQTYYNYFNGTLYIYKDEGKGNLLGTYKCTNPNTIASNTTSLDSCFLAKETKLLNRQTDSTELGYLPIFNNRYIFIQDGASINLYDLKQNQLKVTYTEVDAGFYNAKQTFNFVESANTLIMAKSSKSNSYGLIRLEASNLNGVIGFENSEIRYLNNAFLTKKTDGTYHLFSSETFKEITNSNTQIKNEIVDYNTNYLKVANGDKFNIYDMSGKIVATQKELYQVELFDKFFIGIDTDKLINVYSYKDGLPVEIVDLNPESPSNKILIDDYAKAYNVKVSDQDVTVNVLDNTGAVATSFKVSLENLG